jgi:hypothetical protein
MSRHERRKTRWCDQIGKLHATTHVNVAEPVWLDANARHQLHLPTGNVAIVLQS